MHGFTGENHAMTRPLALLVTGVTGFTGRVYEVT
jgi:hypothetical protein